MDVQESRFKYEFKKNKTERFKLLVQEKVIPNIEGNPIKCLGKWYDDSLTGKNNISSTKIQVEEWLKTDKSGLSGKYKWIYQKLDLPTWPAPKTYGLLTVYKVPRTSVDSSTGRQGLGTSHFQQWSKSTLREKGTMDEDEVQKLEEEGTNPSSLQLNLPGQDGTFLKE